MSAEETPTVDVTIKDVPVERARDWERMILGVAADDIAAAARAALAEYEASRKRRYEAIRLDGGGWKVRQDRTYSVALFDSTLPTAEAEARALTDRLNGEVDGFCVCDGPIFWASDCGVRAHRDYARGLRGTE